MAEFIIFIVIFIKVFNYCTINYVLMFIKVLMWILIIKYRDEECFDSLALLFKETRLRN